MSESVSSPLDLEYRSNATSRVTYAALSRIGTELKAAGLHARRALLCSDETVFSHHGRAVEDALNDAGIDVQSVRIPAGEEQKNLENVHLSYSRFAALGVERGDLVIALGGGVVGDLFGFVAASYLRGLRLIQIPTSVVAQVDSSIGGKVGVDLPEGKNLVGAFKHPELVLIDTATLATLSAAEWVAGTAEVAKHGVIADSALFRALEANPLGWQTRSRPVDEILRAAIAVKARIVQMDERETGVRMNLNYGHTLGHALEKAAGYRGLRHGEAIGWGMAMAARLALNLGVSSANFVRRQDDLLRALGLLQPLPPLDEHAVFDALFLDKKVKGGRLRWILPVREPGSVVVRDDVPLDLVRTLSDATVSGSLLALPLVDSSS